MVGLLDFFTGGDPTEMAQIDPRYGVPRADVRDAAVNALANISATLLAAGQPIMPAQRAQIFSQLGQAASGVNTDLYNASQRRLMTAQMDQRRQETDEIKRIGDLMKSPDAFKAATGYDLQQFGGMRAQDISQALRQIRIQRLGQDPLEAEQRRLQVEQLRRTMNEPRTVEAGGALYQFNSQTNRWDRVTEPRPQGGLEGDAQATILQGMRNPELVNSPEYALAWTRLYGGRTEVRNGEVVQIQPSIPEGVPRPSAAALRAAADTAAGGGPTASGAPPTAGAPGGETRTVTTPGGAQVSITSTQPRQLAPSELKLKEETESNLQSMRDAEGSLREALRLSPQAYAGPGAALRGAAAGATGFDQNSAVATRSLTSIMTEQALSQLRSIFGGNPTEGERKILLDMGASANMSRAEREALLNRAIAAVQRRQTDAERRLREVSSGEYGRVQPGYTPPAAAPSAPALPPGFEVIR
jgi:hypothetical protein